MQAFVGACVFSSLGVISRSGIAEPCGISLVTCRGHTRPIPKGYSAAPASQRCIRFPVPVFRALPLSALWILAILGHVGTVSLLLGFSPVTPPAAACLSLVLTVIYMTSLEKCLFIASVHFKLTRLLVVEF